jgi:ribonuclease HI
VYLTGSIPTIEIYIYTDSESNIKRINQNQHRRRPEFPNKILSPSWDLHQAIHRELTKLPNIAIHHIKAHQDRSTPNAELSWEAKLNIEADRLAKEAYSSSTFSDEVPMILSAQLLIDGKTIVSKHRVIARDIRQTKAIKLQIQEQT